MSKETFESESFESNTRYTPTNHPVPLASPFEVGHYTADSPPFGAMPRKERRSWQLSQKLNRMATLFIRKKEKALLKKLVIKCLYGTVLHVIKARFIFGFQSLSGTIGACVDVHKQCGCTWRKGRKINLAGRRTVPVKS